jgi:hypothetical protein
MENDMNEISGVTATNSDISRQFMTTAQQLLYHADGLDGKLQQFKL